MASSRKEDGGLEKKGTLSFGWPIALKRQNSSVRLQMT